MSRLFVQSNRIVLGLAMVAFLASPSVVTASFEGRANSFAIMNAATQVAGIRAAVSAPAFSAYGYPAAGWGYSRLYTPVNYGYAGCGGYGLAGCGGLGYGYGYGSGGYPISRACTTCITSYGYGGLDNGAINPYNRLYPYPMSYYYGFDYSGWNSGRQNYQSPVIRLDNRQNYNNRTYYQSYTDRSATNASVYNGIPSYGSTSYYNGYPTSDATPTYNGIPSYGSSYGSTSGYNGYPSSDSTTYYNGIPSYGSTSSSYNGYPSSDSSTYYNGTPSYGDTSGYNGYPTSGSTGGYNGLTGGEVYNGYSDSAFNGTSY